MKLNVILDRLPARSRVHRRFTRREPAFGSVAGGSNRSEAAGDERSTGWERESTGLYTELGTLPHLNPDDDHDPLPPAVTDLRERIQVADALLFCTPEYAGAPTGSSMTRCCAATCRPDSPH